MSNTRNTPIEALELEHPLRVGRYELLYGSGGAGVTRGGDGLVRSLIVLEKAEISLLTERRSHPPIGAKGGADGRCGRNLHGDREVSAKAGFIAEPGDMVTVETPGGGGMGSLESRPSMDLAVSASEGN
jgi:N-methylhydantoinase B